MNAKLSRTTRFVNKLLYLGSAAMMLAAIALSAITGSVAATGNSGAIWTTDGACGTSSQDVNHFLVGDHVYINFSGFAAGTYAWQIQQVSGNPKPVIASGIFTVGATGAGCFPAHTIQSDESGREYSVAFGTKNDNYQVNALPTPTQTGTPDPTATETVTPTDEATPTSQPTGSPTPTDEITPTSQPTENPTPTDEITPTEEVTPTGEPTKIPQGEATPTPPSRSIPVLLPLTLALDPFCNNDGQLQWTVENPNAQTINMTSFSVDGGAPQKGFPVNSGEFNLTTTAPGTHTVTITYAEGKTASLTKTLAVCPLPIPVTASALIIPVTGAEENAKVSSGLFMGGLSLFGLGLILSSLRKLLQR